MPDLYIFFGLEEIFRTHTHVNMKTDAMKEVIIKTVVEGEKTKVLCINRPD
jgi:hypothetical protein